MNQTVGHGSTLRSTPSFGDGSHPLYDEKCGYDPLREAAIALYHAGRWIIPVEDANQPHPCPADAQAALWERLRDALGLQPGTATARGFGARRATPDEARKIFNGMEREVIRDLIGSYANEVKELRDRVQGLLEANNREVERRRGAEALLREAAALFRTYAEHHRSKVEPAAPETSPRELDEAIERIKKAERNEEIAGRIEAFLAGAST